MMIKLENNWVIEVDPNCYTLRKYVKTVTDKDGVERNVYTNDKYYGTLKQAILGYIRVSTAEVLADKEMSLTDALKCVDKRLEHIEQMLDEITRENHN